MNNFEVITYEETVVFNYNLPDDEKTYELPRDLTFVWEESLEDLFKEKGNDINHEVHTFSNEMMKNKFIEKIEEILDEDIEEVEEEIANKTKFGFEFTGQLHNDD
jgi:Cft2 family RNA processing exonuclease